MSVNHFGSSKCLLDDDSNKSSADNFQIIKQFLKIYCDSSSSLLLKNYLGSVLLLEILQFYMTAIKLQQL